MPAAAHRGVTPIGFEEEVSGGAARSRTGLDGFANAEIPRCKTAQQQFASTSMHGVHKLHKLLMQPASRVCFA